MSFPRYPKYKDSGVEWLGDVPEHWEIIPVRFAFQNLDYKRVPLAGEDRADVEKIYPYYGASRMARIYSHAVHRLHFLQQVNTGSTTTLTF